MLHLNSLSNGLVFLCSTPHELLGSVEKSKFKNTVVEFLLLGSVIVDRGLYFFFKYIIVNQNPVKVTLLAYQISNSLKVWFEDGELTLGTTMTL